MNNGDIKILRGKSEETYIYYCEQAMVDIEEDYKEWSNLRLQVKIVELRELVK